MRNVVRPAPSYRRHRPTGQAVVTLNGRDFYLGKYNTPESHEAYARKIAEWNANGQRLLPKSTEGQPVLVLEVLNAFLHHAQQHYVDPDGNPTSELTIYKHLMKFVNGLYGSTAAERFGPLALKALRQKMIDQKWKRKSINKQVNRIKAIFRWAVAQEIIPPAVSQALEAVDGLRKGRGGAPESEPVRPVPQAYIDAIKPHVSRQVWSLIQLQLVTGARPGELLRLRPIDIDTSSDKTEDEDKRLWFYRPDRHKNAYRDQPRTIYFGQKAKEIIKPYLAGRNVTAYLFSPVEAEAERHVEQRKKRKSDVQPSQVRRGEAATANAQFRQRPPGDYYTIDSYRRAIEKGCRKADKAAHKENREIKKEQIVIPSWHPHQLRHNAGTIIRREFGVEMAQLILGHRSLTTTEIYAEADHEKAQEIMRKIG